MKRLSLILLTLTLLLSPTQLSYHLWPAWSKVFGIRIDYLSPTLYLFDITVSLLLFVALYIYRHPLLKFLKKHRVLVLLVSLGIIFLVFASLRPTLAFYKWLRLLCYAGLSLYIYKNRTEVRSLVKLIFPFSIIWLSCLSLLQVIERGSVGGLFYLLGERTFSMEGANIARAVWFGHETLRPYATLPHPNALSGFLILMILTLIHLKSRMSTVLFLIAISAFPLILTQSEGSLVAITISFFFLVLAKKRIASSMQKVLLGVLVLAVSVLPLLGNTGLGLTKSISERIYLLFVGYKLFMANPLTGVGLGNFIPGIETLQTVGINARLLQPVHNVFVLLLSETGIFVASAVLGVAISFAQTTPLLFVFITSLFDHYWVTLPQLMVLLSITLPLTLVRPVRDTED